MINENIYHAGKLSLNTSTQKVSLGTKIIHLTEREYKILECLIKNVNDIISRKNLLETIWGDTFDTFSNVIDVHVKNLRKKIQVRSTIKIESIRGVGYRLTVT